MPGMTVSGVAGVPGETMVLVPSALGMLMGGVPGEPGITVLGVPGVPGVPGIVRHRVAPAKEPGLGARDNATACATLMEST